MHPSNEDHLQFNILKGVKEISCWPAAAVADADAVQAGNSEDEQGQDSEDNIKHSDLWVVQNTEK